MTTVSHASAWVDHSAEPEHLVVHLRGELDLAACRTIEPAVMGAIETCPSVALDLSALTFCDSSGIAMFLRAYTCARTTGTILELRGIRPSVARVFALAGVVLT